ncbi:hypothetical protein FRC00_003061 [Tulasnella sp. 408]|nr:hypothetical protein FRC00_003061 [Tulasnella sp. 408]
MLQERWQSKELGTPHLERLYRIDWSGQVYRRFDLALQMNDACPIMTTYYGGTVTCKIPDDKDPVPCELEACEVCDVISSSFGNIPYGVSSRNGAYGLGLYTYRNPALAHQVAISDDGRQTRGVNYALIQCRVITQENFQASLKSLATANSASIAITPIRKTVASATPASGSQGQMESPIKTRSVDRNSTSMDASGPPLSRANPAIDSHRRGLSGNSTSLKMVPPPAQSGTTVPAPQSMAQPKQRDVMNLNQDSMKPAKEDGTQSRPSISEIGPAALPAPSPPLKPAAGDTAQSHCQEITTSATGSTDTRRGRRGKNEQSLTSIAGLLVPPPPPSPLKSATGDITQTPSPHRAGSVNTGMGPAVPSPPTPGVLRGPPEGVQEDEMDIDYVSSMVEGIENSHRIMIFRAPKRHCEWNRIIGYEAAQGKNQQSLTSISALSVPPPPPPPLPLNPAAGDTTQSIPPPPPTLRGLPNTPPPPPGAAKKAAGGVSQSTPLPSPAPTPASNPGSTYLNAAQEKAHLAATNLVQHRAGSLNTGTGPAVPPPPSTLRGLPETPPPPPGAAKKTTGGVSQSTPLPPSPAPTPASNPGSTYLNAAQEKAHLAVTSLVQHRAGSLNTETRPAVPPTPPMRRGLPNTPVSPPRAAKKASKEDPQITLLPSSLAPTPASKSSSTYLNAAQEKAQLAANYQAVALNAPQLRRSNTMDVVEASKTAQVGDPFDDVKDYVDSKEGGHIPPGHPHYNPPGAYRDGDLRSSGTLDFAYCPESHSTVTTAAAPAAPRFERPSDSDTQMDEDDDDFDYFK